MKKRTKKVLKIGMSFSVTIFSLILLFFMFNIINSRPVNKVFEFDAPVTVQNNVIINNNQAYLYNVYGGDFLKSEKYSLPLSQFQSHDGDFEYYLFDETFYGANDTDAQFNGANTNTSFIHKEERKIYLYNTENFTAKHILEDKNIISCSENGSYFLEQDGSEYYFHKRKNLNYEFYSPKKLNISANVCVFCFWINDSYALFFSLTENGKLYFIANAENGETAPAYSIENSFNDFHKELISNRFFINNKSENNIECFNIYLQEVANIKFKNSKTSHVLAISHNATYSVIKSNNDTFLVSKGGKSTPVSQLISEECLSAHFLLDNIVILTTKNTSVVYKLMF